MLPLIGAGIGLIGGIGKMIGRAKANKEMRQLMKDDPTYQINPQVQQRLGLAQSLLNARMPGAAAAERNIYGAAGNAMASAQRNATDASQLLALGAGAQGQAQQGFENLGQMEAQDYQRRYGNLVGAQEAMVGEGDKQYQDALRRYGDKAQLQAAIQENRQNTWGDISGMGFGLMDFGMAGGGNMFKGLFGGGGNAAAGAAFNPMSQSQMGIDMFGLGRAMGSLPAAKKTPFG